MFKFLLKPIGIAIAAIIPSLAFAQSYSANGDSVVVPEGEGGITIVDAGTSSNALSSSNQGELTVTGASIEISGVQGAYASSNSSILIGEEDRTASVNMSATGTAYFSTGINANSSSINVFGHSIEVSATTNQWAYVNAVRSTSEGNALVGSSLTELLSLSSSSNLENDNSGTVFASGSLSKIELHGKIIEANATTTGKFTRAVVAEQDSQIAIGGEETNCINLTVEDQSTKANPEVDKASAGVFSNNGTIVLQVNESIAIKATSKNGDAYGISAINGGNVSVKGGNKLDLSVIATSENEWSTSAGILAMPKSSVDIDADTLTVSTNGTEAIVAQNNTPPQDGEKQATITINANKTTVTAENRAALAAYSYSRLEVNGDLEATAKDVIVARGDSTIDINKSGTGTVVLNGDIRFQAGDENSGNSTNANVNVVLSGADSVWNGNVVRQYKKADADKSEVTGLHVTLADGAVWNADRFPSDENETIKEERTDVDVLTLNNGAINIVDIDDGTGPVAEIARLNGTGGTVKIAAQADSVTGSITTGQLAINSVEETGGNPIALTVSYDGIDADDLTIESAESLHGITGEGANNLKVIEQVKEGDIRGAWTRTNGSENNSGSFAQNTKLEAFKGINAVSLVQWRNQVNHLTKRLGDVRQQSGDIGAWARVYGGEYKWGDANHVDMRSTTVQAGGDARVGDWIIGGAFSYTDSSFDINNGDGDGDLYSIAIYGSRLFDKGSYVDFVARYGYIKNDFKAGNMDAGLDSNAFGLSIETGHAFKFMDHAYVEPQIEVSYGYVQGDDAKASNGVKLDQDDYQNLVTRVGLRTGFEFPEDAGTIYAHASYSYDFLGDADGTASKDGIRSSLSDDLGGGWVTYGIGGQFSLGQSTFAYGELERSTGGDVENPWAFNIGIRHLF